MPVTRTETDFGPGGYGTGAANVPGAPSFVSNTQFRITSSNDVLVLTSSEGGPVSIDVADGIYTEAALATELASKMNANGTLTGGSITFAVTYDATTNKFTIDATSGYTIAFTLTGSDGADTFGFDESASAAQTITSNDETVGVGTITFDFSANDNHSVVEYAIYSNTDSKYVGTDGLADDASEAWQTFANWDDGGKDGRVTVVGLSNYTSYTFKIKARNEEDVATAFCANSAAMNTHPALDYGTVSTALEKTITSGNTRVKTSGVTNTAGTAVTMYTTDTSGSQHGAIDLTFKLENYSATASRVLLQYSEDNSTWATGRDFFTIDSSNKVIRFTSGQGTANITVAESAYDDGTALAAALDTAMNADNTLTGTGTVTFTVTWSTTTTLYTIAADVGNIDIDFWHASTTGAWTLGFNDDITAATSIASQEARGDSVRVLTTTEAGTEHTIYWDSYYDAGESEKDTAVYLRLTPYDTSPSGGDAAKVETIATAFTVNNRPVQQTLVASDSRTYDKDTTPILQALMTDIRGGSKLYYRLRIYDGGDNLVLEKNSAISVTGWQYEDTTDSWNSVLVTGVTPLYVDGINRIRYTVQAGDALTADNDNAHSFTIEPSEPRDRS